MAAAHPKERAESALQARVAAMDAAFTGDQQSPADLIQAFATVMGAVSDQGIPDEQAPLIDPVLADRVMARCEAIRRLDAAAPWLAQGPSASGSEQEWVATGRPSWLPPRIARRHRDAFDDVAAVNGDQSPRGPVRGGLFTCTATATQPGMWRTYLLAQGENMLWPRPWHIWRMKPTSNVTIYHVSSAQMWTALVCGHHHRNGGFLHPNWHAVADVADAVHFTPAAVSAIDGLSLTTDLGPIAPTYWTVESTYWLRWSFDDDFGVVSVGATG